MRLYEYLARSAGRFPQRLAMVEPGRSLTYEELVGEVELLAARLSASGVHAGDVVGIRLPNSVSCVTAVFAVSKLHGRLLMLDAALKPVEVARYCEEAGAALLLEPVAAAPNAGPSILPQPAPASVNGAGPNPEDDDSVLLLSSGTTGAPKVVVRTAEPALRIFLDTLPFADGDRVLAMLPFCHSFGFSFVLGAALASGATLYVAAFSPRETAALIERERITVFPASPLVFRLLTQTRFQTPPDFTSVRLSISAGAALPPGVAENGREKFGLQIVQSYGSTESGPGALTLDAQGNEAAGWVGRAYHGVTIEIVSPSGDVLDRGQEGEVTIVSPANGKGYLRLEGGSAEVFPAGRVLTGDIGWQDAAGQVFVVGRKKAMISIAGKKVSPTEVEECLLSHPSVADAQVLGAALGDGDERVKALVVASSPVTSLQLQEFCAGRLADFKVPRWIEFVPSLERGSMGKVRASS